MYVCKCVCIRGWMDGWVDGWMDVGMRSKNLFTIVVRTLVKSIFTHTTLHTIPSLRTQGPWVKPTETIARVKTIQLSYN